MGRITEEIWWLEAFIIKTITGTTISTDEALGPNILPLPIHWEVSMAVDPTVLRVTQVHIADIR